MSLNSDVEKGPANDEMTEADKRAEAEEKKKAEKEKLEFQDSIAVLVAFIIIIGGSVGVVIFKNVYFPDMHNNTFIPLLQQVKYIQIKTEKNKIYCPLHRLVAESGTLEMASYLVVDGLLLLQIVSSRNTMLKCRGLILHEC